MHHLATLLITRTCQSRVCVALTDFFFRRTRCLESSKSLFSMNSPSCMLSSSLSLSIPCPFNPEITNKHIKASSGIKSELNLTN
ncbi:uncharacterized protein DS421_13g434300 [Arachis hypogaea]|nr:uncharacterized protein DS421_13g434300 [Arachis hypogaea]